jgi:hypothetical protein
VGGKRGGTGIASVIDGTPVVASELPAHGFDA